MKATRIVTIYGRDYRVPQNIQRIDHKATHGWQVRYAGSKLISDGDGSPATSLREAKLELARRIVKNPAPTRLQREPSANKTTDLPVGISGPIQRKRPRSSTHEWNFSVSLPRWGQLPRRATIFIGTENTYTKAREEQALERAIQLRQNAEAAYQREATKARRAEVAR